jgi:hypothetical protein
MKIPTIIISLFVLALTAFADQHSDVDLRAILAGASGAFGRAEWQTQDRGSRMRAELKVEGEHLAADADFTIAVGSNAPITVTTGADGKFQFDQRFNTATRPTINAGDTVTVADSSNAAVLFGTLTVH